MPHFFELGGQGRKVLPACAGLLMLVNPLPGLAAEEQWQVGTASSFSSGRYGTASRSEVLHTPITARRLFAAGDVTLVLPLTCIRGNGAVTIVNGAPALTERAGNGDSTRTTTGGRAAGDAQRGSTGSASASPAGGLGPVATTCGFGDIIVRGRYYVIDERGWLPTIALRAHVKAPTASAARGLGTGRPDEGVGLEVSRTLGRGAMVMVDGGFTLIGKPEGVSYNNTWWYDVGVGQNLVRELLTLSVFFEEYRAVVPGSANARDLVAALGVKGAAGWRLQVSGQFGLSDGSPDHGLTIGASRRF